MAFVEQPFDEREKRYFLAEILKASSISPADLLNFIRERGIAPSWMDMALPNGRTPHDCSRAFDALLASSGGSPARFHPPLLEQQSPASKPRKRQPPPGDVSAFVTDRSLHSQQSNFPSINTTSDSVRFQVAPAARAASAEERPAKKRGRPSKAEYEQRVREAEKRGEVYPPPRKRKTPRASLEGMPGEELLTPTKNESGDAGEGSVAKKKAGPKAAAKAASLESPSVIAGDSGFETAADQMQVGTDKAPLSRTLSETQSTDFPAQASLLSGMREYAAQAGVNTAQSSSTLRGDYSMPRTQQDIPEILPTTPNPAIEPGAQTDSAAAKLEATEPSPTNDR